MTTSLVNFLLIIIMFIFLIYIMIIMHKRNKKLDITRPVSIVDTAIETRNIYKVAFNLKTELKADNIALFRFHNGGHYKNKFAMNRFTCVMEVCTTGMTKPMQNDYSGVLVERYAEAMSSLMILDEYPVSNIDFCADPKVREDAHKYGHKSIYLFLIRQLNGEPEAFMAVNYHTVTNLTELDKNKVWMSHNKILNSLNMVKQK